MSGPADQQTTGSGVTDGAGTEPPKAHAHRVVGETRWPMAVAVVAIVVMTVLLPNSLIVHPRWGVPVLECLLLVAVIIGDPGKIDRRSRPVRTLSVTLIALLVGTTLWCTGVLIAQLIVGGAAANSAGARSGFICCGKAKSGWAGSPWARTAGPPLSSSQ